MMMALGQRRISSTGHNGNTVDHDGAFCELTAFVLFSSNFLLPATRIPHDMLRCEALEEGRLLCFSTAKSTLRKNLIASLMSRGTNEHNRLRPLWVAGCRLHRFR